MIKHFLRASVAGAVLTLLAAGGCAGPGTLYLVDQHAQPAEAAGDMTRAAVALLGSLDAPQREKIRIGLDDEERLNWHFVPRRRKGLSLGEMSPEQQRMAHTLLRAALSERGHLNVEQVIELEGVLRELEGPRRDPGLYYLTIFGEPEAHGGGAAGANTGWWGWRFEGHHLSLNFTIVEGRMVAGAPAFFGANPARRGGEEGQRVLAEEEDLGRQLILSLPDAQRATAIIEAEAYPDILTGADREADIGEPRGLAYAQLSAENQARLRALVEHYANRLRPELAAEDLARIDAAGWDNVLFAWAGPTAAGRGHYYRLHGPTFLIEYDNTQDNANHIHTVWRDFKNDFGRDLLREHYEAHQQDVEHGHDGGE